MFIRVGCLTCTAAAITPTYMYFCCNYSYLHVLLLQLLLLTCTTAAITPTYMYCCCNYSYLHVLLLQLLLVSHFIASRKFWLILVIGNSSHMMIQIHTDFRGRENIWQFDIDFHDRRCFHLFWLKLLLFVVYWYGYVTWIHLTTGNSLLCLLFICIMTWQEKTQHQYSLTVTYNSFNLG